MRYLLILTALLIIASCEKDKKQWYRCECTNSLGQITLSTEAEYENATDGLPACQARQDSLINVDSTMQARCYLYNTDGN